MKKTELIAALADKMAIDTFDDVSNNGLQVDSGRTEIGKVVTGVDATLPLFKAAAEAGADLVICHHGISAVDYLLSGGQPLRRHPLRCVHIGHAADEFTIGIVDGNEKGVGALGRDFAVADSDA